jgi:hypothetical protein
MDSPIQALAAGVMAMRELKPKASNLPISSQVWCSTARGSLPHYRQAHSGMVFDEGEIVRW